jgi:hypothetical protein
MDNTVIQPVPGQSIVSSTEGHKRGHGDEGWDKFIAKEVERVGAATALASAHTNEGVGTAATAAALSSGVLATEIKDSRYDVVDQVRNVGSAAALASAKTDANVAASGGHTNEKIAGSTLGLHDKLASGFARGADDACRIEREILGLGTNMVSGFKDAASTAYQLSGQSLLEAAKNAAALQVQATANANLASVQQTNVFNLLSIQGEKLAAAALLDAAKNASASVLLATQNQAATEKSIAACCCATEKELARLAALTIAENDRTRQMITAGKLEDERFARMRLDSAYNILGSRTVPVTPPIV